MACAWPTEGPLAWSLPSTALEEGLPSGAGSEREGTRPALREPGLWREQPRKRRGSRLPGRFFAGCLVHDPHPSESISPAEKWILVMTK